MTKLILQCYFLLDLNMWQYETDTPEVVKFSNLKGDYFLTGLLNGINVVHGEVCKTLFHYTYACTSPLCE